MQCQKKRFLYFIVFAEKFNFANSEDSNYTVISVILISKSRGYKERQVNEKYCKMFVTAQVELSTAAMFLACALNRGSDPSEILKMTTNTGEKYFYLGHWVTTWRP